MKTKAEKLEKKNAKKVVSRHKSVTSEVYAGDLKFGSKNYWKKTAKETAVMTGATAGSLLLSSIISSAIVAGCKTLQDKQNK